MSERTVYRPTYRKPIEKRGQQDLVIPEKILRSFDHLPQVNGHQAPSELHNDGLDDLGQLLFRKWLLHRRKFLAVFARDKKVS